jgi:hypothetical protein
MIILTKYIEFLICPKNIPFFKNPDFEICLSRKSKSSFLFFMISAQSPKNRKI